MTHYIPSHDLAFIHVPKTGGTSILKWIEQNFDYNKIASKHANIFEFTGRKYGSHSRPKNYFTVVRNPYHRILSWYYYQDKMLNKRLEKNKPRENDNELKKLLEVGINDSFTGEKSALYDKNILKPQTKFYDADIKFILYQENLVNDFKKIQKFTNCYKDLPFENKSKNSNNVNILNEKTIKLINEIYSDDFKILGYKKI